MKNKVSEIEISYNPTVIDNTKISTSKDAERILRGFYDDNKIEVREVFSALYLNRANKVIGFSTISIGGVSETIVDMKIIFSIALKSLASGIILCHNHPSGNLDISEPDKQLTKKAMEIGRLMSVPVLDHIILTKLNYVSLSDNGGI
jgi:DNA repair protein RadC